LLGAGAGVLLFALGKGEGAVGLEITVGGIRHPHFGLESAFHQTESGGGGPDSSIKMTGNVERKVHRLIEELRLALSKKDFGG
jgi:hypothetical protein